MERATVVGLVIAILASADMHGYDPRKDDASKPVFRQLPFTIQNELVEIIVNGKSFDQDVLLEKAALASVQPHDLCPDWGSYVPDMEMNLEMDEETWERHQANPAPAYMDLLNDFADSNVLQQYDSDWKTVCKAALINYGCNKTQVEAL